MIVLSTKKVHFLNNFFKVRLILHCSSKAAEKGDQNSKWSGLVSALKGRDDCSSLASPAAAHDMTWKATCFPWKSLYMGGLMQQRQSLCVTPTLDLT